jgi:GAF domain-containing protein
MITRGPTDEIARDAVVQGDRAAIRAILDEVCRITDMGFAAVARVTDTRWIACQVLDRIEFGLDAGDELELSTTICDEIRQSHRAVIIDEVTGHPEWSRHPTPTMYGFESYISLPIILDDGSFFGTLCAIDPRPRQLSAPTLIARMQELARQVAVLLSGGGAG